ncbi:mucin-17-like [Pollicipes pollicipes]|uniref:mucin-17-like n=1 Tax=Pollicipes pollicipes TaxID=41117 RepID=UPI001884DDD2|nr:mucin-17-like [Pollicipes pollicipes]
MAKVVLGGSWCAGAQARTEPPSPPAEAGRVGTQRSLSRLLALIQQLGGLDAVQKLLDGGGADAVGPGLLSAKDRQTLVKVIGGQTTTTARPRYSAIAREQPSDGTTPGPSSSDEAEAEPENSRPRLSLSRRPRPEVTQDGPEGTGSEAVSNTRRRPQYSSIQRNRQPQTTPADDSGDVTSSGKGRRQYVTLRRGRPSATADEDGQTADADFGGRRYVTLNRSRPTPPTKPEPDSEDQSDPTGSPSEVSTGPDGAGLPEQNEASAGAGRDSPNAASEASSKLTNDPAGFESLLDLTDEAANSLEPEPKRRVRIRLRRPFDRSSAGPTEEPTERPTEEPTEGPEEGLTASEAGQDRPSRRQDERKIRVIRLKRPRDRAGSDRSSGESESSPTPPPELRDNEVTIDNLEQTSEAEPAGYGVLTTVRTPLFESALQGAREGEPTAAPKQAVDAIETDRRRIESSVRTSALFDNDLPQAVSARGPAATGRRAPLRRGGSDFRLRNTLRRLDSSRRRTGQETTDERPELGGSLRSRVRSGLRRQGEEPAPDEAREAVEEPLDVTTESALEETTTQRGLRRIALRGRDRLSALRGRSRDGGRRRLAELVSESATESPEFTADAVTDVEAEATESVPEEVTEDPAGIAAILGSAPVTELPVSATTTASSELLETTTDGLETTTALPDLGEVSTTEATPDADSSPIRSQILQEDPLPEEKEEAAEAVERPGRRGLFRRVRPVETETALGTAADGSDVEEDGRERQFRRLRPVGGRNVLRLRRPGRPSEPVTELPPTVATTASAESLETTTDGLVIESTTILPDLGELSTTEQVPDTDSPPVPSQVLQEDLQEEPLPVEEEDAAKAVQRPGRRGLFRRLRPAETETALGTAADGSDVEEDGRERQFRRLRPVGGRNVLRLRRPGRPSEPVTELPTTVATTVSSELQETTTIGLESTTALPDLDEVPTTEQTPDTDSSTVRGQVLQQDPEEDPLPEEEETAKPARPPGRRGLFRRVRPAEADIALDTAVDGSDVEEDGRERQFRRLRPVGGRNVLRLRRPGRPSEPATELPPTVATTPSDLLETTTDLLETTTAPSDLGEVSTTEQAPDTDGSPIRSQVLQEDPLPAEKEEAAKAVERPGRRGLFRRVRPVETETTLGTAADGSDVEEDDRERQFRRLRPVGDRNVLRLRRPGRRPPLLRRGRPVQEVTATTEAPSPTLQTADEVANTTESTLGLFPEETTQQGATAGPDEYASTTEFPSLADEGETTTVVSLVEDTTASTEDITTEDSFTTPVELDATTTEQPQDDPSPLDIFGSLGLDGKADRGSVEENAGTDGARNGTNTTPQASVEDLFRNVFGNVNPSGEEAGAFSTTPRSAAVNDIFRQVFANEAPDTTPTEPDARPGRRPPPRGLFRLQRPTSVPASTTGETDDVPSVARPSLRQGLRSRLRADAGTSSTDEENLPVRDRLAALRAGRLSRVRPSPQDEVAAEPESELEDKTPAREGLFRRLRPAGGQEAAREQETVSGEKKPSRVRGGLFQRRRPSAVLGDRSETADADQKPSIDELFQSVFANGAVRQKVDSVGNVEATGTPASGEVVTESSALEETTDTVDDVSTTVRSQDTTEASELENTTPGNPEVTDNPTEANTDVPTTEGVPNAATTEAVETDPASTSRGLFSRPGLRRSEPSASENGALTASSDRLARLRATLRRPTVKAPSDEEPTTGDESESTADAPLRRLRQGLLGRIRDRPDPLASGRRRPSPLTLGRRPLVRPSDVKADSPAGELDNSTEIAESTTNAPSIGTSPRTTSEAGTADGVQEAKTETSVHSTDPSSLATTEAATPAEENATDEPSQQETNGDAAQPRLRFLQQLGSPRKRPFPFRPSSSRRNSLGSRLRDRLSVTASLSGSTTSDSPVNDEEPKVNAAEEQTSTDAETTERSPTPRTRRPSSLLFPGRGGSDATGASEETNDDTPVGGDVVAAPPRRSLFQPSRRPPPRGGLGSRLRDRLNRPGRVSDTVEDASADGTESTSSDTTTTERSVTPRSRRPPSLLFRNRERDSTTAEAAEDNTEPSQDSEATTVSSLSGLFQRSRRPAVGGSLGSRLRDRLASLGGRGRSTSSPSAQEVLDEGSKNDDDIPAIKASPTTSPRKRIPTLLAGLREAQETPSKDQEDSPGDSPTTSSRERISALFAGLRRAEETPSKEQEDSPGDSPATSSRERVSSLFAGLRQAQETPSKEQEDSPVDSPNEDATTEQPTSSLFRLSRRPVLRNSLGSRLRDRLASGGNLNDRLSASGSAEEEASEAVNVEATSDRASDIAIPTRRPSLLRFSDRDQEAEPAEGAEVPGSVDAQKAIEALTSQLLQTNRKRPQGSLRSRLRDRLAATADTSTATILSQQAAQSVSGDVEATTEATEAKEVDISTPSERPSSPLFGNRGSLSESEREQQKPSLNESTEESVLSSTELTPSLVDRQNPTEETDNPLEPAGTNAPEAEATTTATPIQTTARARLSLVEQLRQRQQQKKTSVKSLVEQLRSSLYGSGGKQETVQEEEKSSSSTTEAVYTEEAVTEAGPGETELASEAPTEATDTSETTTESSIEVIEDELSQTTVPPTADSLGVNPFTAPSTVSPVSAETRHPGLETIGTEVPTSEATTETSFSAFGFATSPVTEASLEEQYTTTEARIEEGVVYAVAANSDEKPAHDFSSVPASAIEGAVFSVERNTESTSFKSFADNDAFLDEAVVYASPATTESAIDADSETTQTTDHRTTASTTAQLGGETTEPSVFTTTRVLEGQEITTAEGASETSPPSTEAGNETAAPTVSSGGETTTTSTESGSETEASTPLDTIQTTTSAPVAGLITISTNGEVLITTDGTNDDGDLTTADPSATPTVQSGQAATQAETPSWHRDPRLFRFDWPGETTSRPAIDVTTAPGPTLDPAGRDPSSFVSVKVSVSSDEAQPEAGGVTEVVAFDESTAASTSAEPTASPVDALYKVWSTQAETTAPATVEPGVTEDGAQVTVGSTRTSEWEEGSGRRAIRRGTSIRRADDAGDSGERGRRRVRRAC